MREISAERITEVVRRLCIEANCHLPGDVKDSIERAYEGESWPQAREILEHAIQITHSEETFAKRLCRK